MSPRSLWTGTISFGLVSVPVRMFSATESKELRFHFLDKHDLQPIAYDKVRRDSGNDVDNDDIVRGFEVEKGSYVPLEDPQDGAEKPYRLLERALEETGKVAIAKVVIRNKQHLAALRPWNGTLVLETMYYADEVRQPERVNGGRLHKPEVELAKSLVENLSATFDPAKYDDTYRKELLGLLRAKAKGKELPEPEERAGRRGRRPDDRAARVGRANAAAEPPAQTR